MYFWLWIGVIVFSIILEIVTVSALVSIWFAPGALVALVANQLNAPITLQVIIFLAVSILCFLTVRPLAKNYLRGNIIHTNADRILNKQTKLIKAINDEYGEIKVDGVIWNAKSVDGEFIELGTLVEVIAIDGSKVIVKRI